MNAEPILKLHNAMFRIALVLFHALFRALATTTTHSVADRLPCGAGDVFTIMSENDAILVTHIDER